MQQPDYPNNWLYQLMNSAEDYVNLEKDADIQKDAEEYKNKNSKIAEIIEKKINKQEYH